MLKKLPWQIKKTILPQHTDHAGVMWHGSYVNLLEESRIKALDQSGVHYFDLLNKNFELPVKSLTLKYIKPIHINEEIIINSYFEISRSPRVVIHSEFINKNNIVCTEAEINLVLIVKDNLSIVRNRPKFLEKAFERLSEGPKN